MNTVVAAAYAEPRLRRLRPVTSHWNLWFSQSATHPYEPVGPDIVPGADGVFRVQWRGTLLGASEDAREAAAIAAAALPEGVTLTG